MKEQLPLDEQFCFTVNETHKLFNKFYQKALENYKLTYTQYTVLLALWEEDNRHLKELAYILSLNSNTLTPLLRRMEEQGWLVRHKPKEDKRQLMIRLTEKGRASKDSIQASVRSCGACLSGLSEEEYRTALLFLQKINQALRED